jgi:hypothetical protein
MDRGPAPRTRVPVLFAFAFLLACFPACGEAPAGKASSQTQLSTPLQPVGPVGQVNGPLTFSWRGTSDDRVVRIYIVDIAERAVTGFDARGQSAPAPPVVLEAIQPRVPMGWRVAVLDENGEPARLSALTRFTWEP